MIKKTTPGSTFENNSYIIDELPGGEYILQAFIDRNGNKEWDKGKSLPWTFAEPFYFLPDTIKVRKRWTKEGVNLDMRGVR